MACFFLRLTYRRERPCRDPLKRDSGRYTIALIGWFLGQEAACFFLRLTYRRDRPCRDPLKRDSDRYAITLIKTQSF